MVTAQKKLARKFEKRKESAKILVVDDDAGIREVLFHILTEEGYKIKTASTGKEAIETCQKEAYDVALIDIKLPDIEGTQVLNVTKKLNPLMSAIIITGYPSLENAIQSLNFGADSFLTKPFQASKLKEQIKEQLERRKRLKLENLLKNTGLSAYETKIYLALALEGPAEARKISQSSGVPRTKAYATLKKLKQRGLILQVPGIKQKFAISQPTGAFSAFVKGWKTEISEQVTSLAALENAISMLERSYEQTQTSKPSNMQREEVWSIQGTDEIEQRIQEMLHATEKSVIAVIAEKGLIFLCKHFGRMLDDLVSKGVNIQIKTPIDKSNIDFIKELRYVYKISDAQVPASIFLLTVDKKELLLAKLNVDDAATVFEDEFGMFAKSEDLAAFFIKSFDENKQRSPKHQQSMSKYLP